MSAHHPIDRRTSLRWLGASALAATGRAGAEPEPFPARPLTVVHPYAAGGPADALARALAQGLGQRLKQAVVVDGKAGGAATIGTGFVARARPDGHTLLLGTSAGHVVTPLMQRVPYDGLADFQFIGGVASQPNVLVVHPDLGIDTLGALVQRARQAPDSLNYASAGTGGATHLGAEAFLQRAQIKVTHVPYSGAAPALKDLLGGQVQMGMLNLAAVRPHVEQGRLKALAYGASQRSSLLPQVPTLAELGWAGAELPTWYTLAAPQGLPADRLQRLAAALADVQKDPAWQQQLTPLGAERLPLGPAQATDFVAADRTAMRQLLGKLQLLGS